jgi:hypothetical protein
MQSRAEKLQGVVLGWMTVVGLCAGSIVFEILLHSSGISNSDLLPIRSIPFAVAGIIFAFGRSHLVLIAIAFVLLCLCDTVTCWHLAYPALDWFQDAAWVSVFYPIYVFFVGLPIVCYVRWQLGRSSIIGRPKNS